MFMVVKGDPVRREATKVEDHLEGIPKSETVFRHSRLVMHEISEQRYRIKRSSEVNTSGTKVGLLHFPGLAWRTTLLQTAVQ